MTASRVSRREPNGDQLVPPTRHLQSALSSQHMGKQGQRNETNAVGLGTGERKISLRKMSNPTVQKHTDV